MSATAVRSTENPFAGQQAGALRQQAVSDLQSLLGGNGGAAVLLGGKARMSSEDVQRLQFALNAFYGKPVLNVDGDFGKATRRVLSHAQRELSRTAGRADKTKLDDGVSGQVTYNNLIARLSQDNYAAPSAPVGQRNVNRPTRSAIAAPAEGTRTGVQRQGNRQRTATADNAERPQTQRERRAATTDTRGTGRAPRVNWPRSLSSYDNVAIQTQLRPNENISLYYDKHYGTARTVELVRRVAQRYRAATGRVLRVGDLSQRGGGNIDGHKAHANGRNIDLDLSFNDGRTRIEPNREGNNATFRSPAYDRDATRELIRIIKQEYPGAKVFFNDPVLIQEGLTSYLGNHDNHLHIQNLI